MRVLISLLTLTALSCRLLSATVPSSNAYIVLTDKTGNNDTLYVGSAASSSYEAPLTVTFDAGLSGVEPGTSVFCEWRVVRTYDDEGYQREEQYLIRQDEHSEIEIPDDGMFTVNFAYSYKLADSDEIVPGEEKNPIKFTIDGSDLYVPNAFSPNGDGKNDVFKVRVKSIVKFSMIIFNRWGQVVASGDQNSLKYEAGDDNNGYFICWDGTSNGKTVQDGVYFIHIEADGAGGYHYTRKTDVNILTSIGYDGY